MHSHAQSRQTPKHTSPRSLSCLSPHAQQCPAPTACCTRRMPSKQAPPNSDIPQPASSPRCAKVLLSAPLPLTSSQSARTHLGSHLRPACASHPSPECAGAAEAQYW
ncbi:hypothetical protein BD779DRAFT_473761 [Infundibulicybe gibba]|nr:hypothetical protein BD779DRAFT_473761 [Infundibulicybe gibba]